MRKFIDLHTHSTESDGSFTPAELVKLALEKGLSAIAITDHETYSGVQEAIDTAYGTELEVIPGTELSTCCKVSDDFSAKIHIVGLFIDINNKALRDKTEEYKGYRIKRNYYTIDTLASEGIDISMEILREKYGSDAITRAHVAQYLLEKGYINSTDEAYTDKYIGDNSKAYRKREYMDAVEAVQLITGAGGIAVFAHPLIYDFSEEQLQGIIDTLKPHGLMAIESEYSTFTSAQIEYVKKLALKNDLLLSGGSDFHGTLKPDIDLGTGHGNLEIPYEYMTDMKNYCKLRDTK